MSLNFDNYISSNPVPYGRKLLRDIGKDYHYINEREVVDYLGYEIKTMTPDAYAGFGDVIGEIFDDTCAILLRKHNLILLSDTLSSRHERLTLFHEIGHDILPWHQAYSFSLRGKDIGHVVHKKIEHEAFLAGSELMFPLEHFMEDSLSLPGLSFRSIKKLADRYNGSFEATSIRYALTNQNIMAIAVVTENPHNGEAIRYINHRRKRHDMFTEPPSKTKVQVSAAPLRIQYCTRSHRFPKFIKSGTPIEKENIIYECWSQRSERKGEIPASMFTPSARFKYSAKCIYNREAKKVFVILWLPNLQQDIF